MFTRELSFTYSKKERCISSTKRSFFTIDQYLSVLIPENYTSIQEYITRLDVLEVLDVNAKLTDAKLAYVYFKPKAKFHSH